MRTRASIGKILIYIFSILVVLACVLPLVLIIVVSFTDESIIIRNGYSFFPNKLSLDAYRTLFTNGEEVFRSYRNSIVITVVGTVIATLITGMAAYTLANPNVHYRNGIAMYFFITMVFSGGMVPWYIISKKFGFTENIFALIVPTLIFNPFNLFLVRNYMADLPLSLMESAKLDGANDWVIAFRIYFPLSMPILATVALFYSIAYWNDWWNAIMLVSNTRLYPIQYFLMKLRSEMNMMKNLQRSGFAAGGVAPRESLQMATAAITIGPILLFYPVLQKHIVKGLVVGSVKG